MKLLRLNRVGITLVFLFLVGTFLAFAMSGKLAFIHAATSTTVKLTVNISSPVKSAYIMPLEGGPGATCVYTSGKVITVTSGSPININEYNNSASCQGNPSSVKYIETGAGGTSMTVNVP